MCSMSSKGSKRKFTNIYHEHSWRRSRIPWNATDIPRHAVKVPSSATASNCVNPWFTSCMIRKEFMSTYIIAPRYTTASLRHVLHMFDTDLFTSDTFELQRCMVQYLDVHLEWDSNAQPIASKAIANKNKQKINTNKQKKPNKQKVRTIFNDVHVYVPCKSCRIYWHVNLTFRCNVSDAVIVNAINMSKW